METNKETVSHQAEQIKKQATELMSKIDVKKAVGWTDIFMAKIFFFGKIVAALFMFLCIATMALSLLYWALASESGVKIPDFSDVKEAYEAAEKSENDNSGDMKSLKETNSVRKEFDSEITKLMEVCKLPKESYEEIVRTLAEMDADLRDDYIDGAIDFAKDAKKTIEKMGKTFNGTGVIVTYDKLYAEAKETAEADKATTAIKKMIALSVCGGALIGLILFLIIPLLIQIEENTRKN